MKWVLPISLTMVMLLSLPARGQAKLDSTAMAQEALAASKLYLQNPDASLAAANALLAKAIEGKSKYFEGYSYYIISKANWATANFRLSTEFGFKALKIFENSAHVHMWGKTLLSLSRTFIDLGNFDQASDFINQSMDIVNTNEHDTLRAEVYRERSMLLTQLHQYDSALHYVDLAMGLSQLFKDSIGVSILYGRKARIYFNLKDYDKSMAFTRDAIRIDSLVGNNRALGVAYFLAGQNEFNRHHVASSIDFLKKSIRLGNEIGNLSTLVKAHSYLAEVYFSQGNATSAYKQLSLADQFKDSLYSSEKSGQIQEMQTLYELGNKESTIRMLEQENRLKQHQVSNQRMFTIFLLVGMFLLILLIFVLWRLRVLQKRTNDALEIKNKAIEQQREELQTQAENLQQLSQLKSKLFSVIGHDLRGPIGNLQALLELLTSRAIQPEEFFMLSDKLKANLNVTQRTLENLLNWSLSQMEGIRTEHRKLEIKNLIDEACYLMEEVAERKNIVVENASPAPVYVFADFNQIQLIIRNLLHNAIKFSKANGKVLVTASADTANCYVSIKDFGIGMTPEETEMILGSKYFTKQGTQQEKGTGLGLLLCKEFIKRNGGELNIQSNPGDGTEVSFSLPLV